MTLEQRGQWGEGGSHVVLWGLFQTLGCAGLAGSCLEQLRHSKGIEDKEVTVGRGSRGR